ncbi:MAG: caspase family protein, partial [Bacteroidota bacterium]|nr:caspase family protein [Bacteroidota bacterium]
MKKYYILTIAVLTLTAVFCPTTLKAQKASEISVNSQYRDAIMNYLRQDIQQRQQIMAKRAEQILINLPNEEKLYDETFVTIKTDIAEALREDGRREYNYIFDISYNCKHIEGVSDDYPVGVYDYNASNSARAICNLTKIMVEEVSKDLFREGKSITTRITATTDDIEINHIPYNGEYGDFRYCPTNYNGENVRISVNKEEGITTNAQLAYLRAQSVKGYLEANVAPLRRATNKYEFITKTYDKEGSQYRRSSIEIIVHGAFDETMTEMNNRLINDEYVDFNIPVNEAGANANTFALIITNYEYAKPLPSVPFANNDGEIFYQYCVKTLSIPERHVKLLRNANAEVIKNEGVNWLKDITVALNGEANIILYYAGHGFTDAEYNPYIIPTDINSSVIKAFNGKTSLPDEMRLKKCEAKNLIKQCISLDTICNSWFNRVKFKSLTFVLDAGFDGTQRNGHSLFTIKKSVKKMKGMRIRNDVVMFAAADWNKPAYSFDQQHHGFLTYFMLKEIKRTRGDIDYGTLFETIDRQLNYESSLQGKLQQPKMVLGNKAKE